MKKEGWVPATRRKARPNREEWTMAGSEKKEASPATGTMSVPERMGMTEWFDRWPDLFGRRWPDPFRNMPFFGEGCLLEQFTDDDGTIVLRAELPGLDVDDDVDIHVEDGRLTISGHREERDENREKGSYRKRVPVRLVRADRAAPGRRPRRRHRGELRRRHSRGQGARGRRDRRGHQGRDQEELTGPTRGRRDRRGHQGRGQEELTGPTRGRRDRRGHQGRGQEELTGPTPARGRTESWVTRR